MNNNKENPDLSLEKLLQASLDAIQDGINVVDKDLTILKTNKVSEERYRASMPLIGKKCYKVFQGRDKPCDHCHSIRAIESGKPAHSEMAMVQGGKNTGWLEIFAYPLVSDAGEIIGAVEYVRDITARKEAEKKLQERERLFRTTLYSIGDAVITTDIACKVQRMNPVAEQLTGWLESEATGRPLTEIFRIINENTRQPVENPAEIVIKEGMIVGLANHTALIDKNGQEKPIADSGAPIISDEGQVTGVVMVFRDQTEEVEMRKAIEESEEKYRSLIEQSSEMVYLHDQDGNIAEVNQAAVNWSGYSREELLSMNIFDLHPVQAGRDDVLRQWRSWKPGVETFTLEFSHKRKDGTISPVEISTGKIKVGSERLILALVRDVTERHEAASAIEESREWYRALAEDIPVLLTRVSPQGKITYVNNASLSLLGKSQEDIIGYDFFELVPPEFREYVRSKFMELTPENPIGTYEHENRSRIFLWRNRAIFRDDGTLVEYFTVGEDITELKEAEEALRQQICFEKLVADISSAFVSAPFEKNDEVVNSALKNNGEFFGADRSYLFRFTEDGQHMSVISEWCAEGISSQIERNRHFPVANTLWWVKQIYDQDYVNIPDVMGLPPEAEIDKLDFLVEEIKSILTLPLVNEGKVIGFLGLDAVKEKKNWNEHQISLLKVVAEIIAGALVKYEIEEALKESEERYREILKTIEEGYYEADLSGNITYCNQAACRLFGGYSMEELIGISYEKLYKDPVAAFKAFNRVFSTGQPERGLILEMVLRDGSRGYGEISISLVKDKAGSIKGFKGIGKNVTERIQYEEKLKYLSLHDQLTGIYNRAYFENELTRLSDGREFPVTIISADLDGLKLINDTMGHDAGDKLLKACANVLKDSIRESDILSRVGGDEFSAILPHTDKATGEKIVRRIREKTNLYNQTNEDLPLGISVGVATAETNESSLRSLFKRADDMMYRDKLYRSSSSRGKIVQSLLAALAERDYITEGHARRLEELCRSVGEKIKLSSHQLTDLALLAQVHDLGKVGIPDQILFKQGPLTEEEWEIMRGHPEKGFRIASSSPDLASVAELILKHHERWDGCGYPLGLKETEIPVECRILSLVDAYDAMTNKRPYNKLKTADQAIDELTANAGSQFDPDLVPVFLQVLEEDNIVP